MTRTVLLKPALFGYLSLGAALCAALFALAGYFGPGAVENALHKGILENIVWRPDSPAQVDARFRGEPDADGVPDYFRVWLWNLTNLAEVRRGAKPKMVEVGPLTYVKSRVRLDPRWDRRGRVTVKEWDYHVFRPELSSASPNDTIVTLNLPLVGVLELLHAYSASVPAVQPLLDVLVGVLSKWRDDHVDGLFTRRTAGELMWGYEDLLLQRLALLLGPTYVKTTRVQLLRNESLEEVRTTKGFNMIDTGWRPAGQEAAAEHRPTAASGGRVYDTIVDSTTAAGRELGGRRGGARLGRQAANEALYDEHQIWNMEMESGWTQVASWGPNCTEPVRGTDAFQFRPGLDRDSVLRVWIAELFRSAALLHVADVELQGVRLMRFVPEPREAEPDPCHHQFIRGLANVTVPMAVGPAGNGSSEAAHGVPVLMSLPHYCQVDEAVPAALDGISECDPNKYGIFLDVEPTSGITMRAAKRLQLSSQLTTTARATLEPSIGTSLILPIFWAEEASEISAVQAAAFRRSVYTAQRVAATLRRVGYPAAALAAAVAAALVAVAALRMRATGDVRRQPQVPTVGGGGGVGVAPSPLGPDSAPVPPPVIPSPAAAATAGAATAAAAATAATPAAFDGDDRSLQQLKEEEEGDITAGAGEA